ncbi:MAG: hypothetical protein ACREQ3_18000, partial [Candidatus Binatia bacterium]
SAAVSELAVTARANKYRPTRRFVSTLTRGAGGVKPVKEVASSQHSVVSRKESSNGKNYFMLATDY